jgi:hypothetical protein
MPEWVTMSYASKQLNLSKGVLSRLASRGKIQTQLDPTDERVRLVDLEELKKMYAVRSHRESKG